MEKVRKVALRIAVVLILFFLLTSSFFCLSVDDLHVGFILGAYAAAAGIYLAHYCLYES